METMARVAALAALAAFLCVLLRERERTLALLLSAAGCGSSEAPGFGEEDLSLAVAAPEGGLTDADTAKIVDVVNQTAGFTADQIKIIAVEPDL